MHTRLTVSSSLLSHMQRGRRGAARRIQVKLEGSAPSRAERERKKKSLREGGRGGRRGRGVVFVCVEREGGRGGGGGGGVRPAAVAMATTSRCCRSRGSQREERASL